MSFEDRDIAFRHSVSWFAIGFRFGLGFFAALIVGSALALVLWLGGIKLATHVSLDEAANEVRHTLDSVPHPSLPQPSKPRSFKVDPRDRDQCLKLSNGVVNQQFMECMQENASSPSP